MLPFRRAAPVLALLGVLAACKSRPAPAAGVGAAALDGTALDVAAAESVPQRTTRGDLALRNLSDRIATLDERAARGPLKLPVREQLLDALLQRATFAGTFSDFDRALELGESAVVDFNQNPQALALRARARAALHRFEEAASDLEAAARLGAKVDAKLAAIRIAQGRELEAARDHARAQVARSRSLEHLGLLANAEAALGEFESADEHYAAALATLHDVTPFPVAQLCFQRGVMWAESAARPERALPYYAEAVRRLPGYVVANVHLAELEASLGRPAAAIERLRTLIDETADPEPAGYLGELLAAHAPGDAAAAALIERARGAYQRLLDKHRAAFLDHAAEFFAGPGKEPALASRLAQENLALRQTPRAYALVIESALAAQDSALACRALLAAQPLRHHSKNLADLLENESARCATR